MSLTSAPATLSDTDESERLRAVLEQFASLQPGESFALTTSQDPTPLRQALRSRLGVSLVWEMGAAEPTQWQVNIGKRGASGASCCSGGACGG